ncbi:hypothetical protein [Methylococcus capsulatus]|uniref:hypothetical protein n=1 Tax=Methylococcus capsulatus TaxID=414 RepID=UPI001EE65033|nr:hypothetical protein [Methylococcus capsulatus]
MAPSVWPRSARVRTPRGTPGAIEALRESVAAQGQRSRVRWADALSVSVRPMITCWFRALYCAAKTATSVGAISGGAD